MGELHEVDRRKLFYGGGIEIVVDGRSKKRHLLKSVRLRARIGEEQRLPRFLVLDQSPESEITPF
jgi:hypothetical protein